MFEAVGTIAVPLLALPVNKKMTRRGEHAPSRESESEDMARTQRKAIILTLVEIYFCGSEVQQCTLLPSVRM